GVSGPGQLVLGSHGGGGRHLCGPHDGRRAHMAPAAWSAGPVLARRAAEVAMTPHFNKRLMLFLLVMLLTCNALTVFFQLRGPLRPRKGDPFWGEQPPFGGFFIHVPRGRRSDASVTLRAGELARRLAGGGGHPLPRDSKPAGAGPRAGRLDGRLHQRAPR